MTAILHSIGWGLLAAVVSVHAFSFLMCRWGAANLDETATTVLRLSIIVGLAVALLTYR